MKRLFGFAFRVIGAFLLLTVLYIGSSLALGTFNDYRPKSVLPIGAAKVSNQKNITDSTLTFLTWNIGFGGLGKESDFFMVTEGMYWTSEKNVRAEEKYVEKNVEGITDFIQKSEADFYLLQEVDVNSKRSYFKNEFEMIAEEKEGFFAAFSPNYNIPRNPVPVFQPWNTYGKVLSGLGTYSKYQPIESTRLQLPGEFSWPDRVFHLDRCVSVHRFSTDFQKDLAVLNIHNSAFDKGGFMKTQQLDFLKDLALKEYEKGNYVILGGDWNMCPPGFPPEKFRKFTVPRSKTNIADDLIPEGWKWAFDESVPTIRSTAHQYDSEKTFVTVIDAFLVSPNVIVEEVKGFDLGFEYSDHQPVWMRIRLNQ